MLTGQSGILNMARKAADETKVADLKESIELDFITEVTANGGADLSVEQIKSILLKYFDKTEVEAKKTEEWEKFPEGFVFKTKIGNKEESVDIAELYNSNISGDVTAGVLAKVPAGKEDTWTAEKVTPVADGNGGVVPIPKDFYYVGGTKDTGFVISDDEDDENKGVDADLKGNQFVWVPCGDDGVDYIQNNSNWMSNYSSYEWWYLGQEDKNESWQWKDEHGTEGNKAKDVQSVKDYEGFYIGRFEAGLPDSLSGASSNTYDHITTDVGTGRDVDTERPVSKKNNPSWNLITQANAKEVSKNMYDEGSSVRSQLIDGNAWDTTVEWIKKSGKNVTNSTSYGNYQNSSITLGANSIYAMHLCAWEKTANNDTGWKTATKYSNGPWSRKLVGDNDEEITSANITTYIENYSGWKKAGTDWGKEQFDLIKDTHTVRGRAEIATGAVETTKTNNIYDLAGNMWEWTTEVGDHSTSVTIGTYAVFRGGCFDNAGSSHPVCYRGGSRNSSNNFDLYIGFRVILYVK